jgi:uncharacterized membrane protein (UPF0127 family)
VRILSLVLLAFLIVSCGETSERPGADPPGPDNPSLTTESSAMETTTEAAKTASEPAQPSKLRTVSILTASGEEVRVRVEIADDVSEQARGLMYRTSLAENRGMLFVYRGEEQRSFYMKNTLIPLSIAFIDSEGRIVDIQDMKPLDDDLPHYVSAKPAQYGLEVNQGFFEERGVKVGDRAELPV